jgi:hypothetical protein
VRAKPVIGIDLQNRIVDEHLDMKAFVREKVEGARIWEARSKIL